MPKRRPGSAFIFLGWRGLRGTPLWGVLVIAAAWSAFVFWKVGHIPYMTQGLTRPGFAGGSNS